MLRIALQERKMLSDCFKDQKVTKLQKTIIYQNTYQNFLHQFEQTKKNTHTWLPKLPALGHGHHAEDEFHPET
jgi:spore coat protein CotF